jgi:invasion protein IalB
MRLPFASVCLLAVALCTSAVAQDTKQPTLVFSAWTKGCVQTDARERTCAIRKTGRLEAGTPVVAASLIESTGSSKKILRVTLPVGMSLQPGTRVIIDQGQPATAAYVNCVADGCMADYDVNADMINRLKKGQGLVVQGINGSGQAISLVVPLSDFAKAYDGPSTDPQAFEKEQKKLSAELKPIISRSESLVF